MCPFEVKQNYFIIDRGQLLFKALGIGGALFNGLDLTCEYADNFDGSPAYWPASPTFSQI